MLHERDAAEDLNAAIGTPWREKICSLRTRQSEHFRTESAKYYGSFNEPIDWLAMWLTVAHRSNCDALRVVDVGANRGQLLQGLDKLCAALSPKGNPWAMLAFEPGYVSYQEYLFPAAQNARSGLATAVRAAVGAESGFVRLTGESDTASDTGQHIHIQMSRKRAVAAAPAEDLKNRNLRVPLVRLDDELQWWAPPDGRIDVLKIDTEGFEIYVTAGALHTLQRRAVPFVFLECHQLWQSTPAKWTILNASLTFDELGYDFFRLYHKGLLLLNGPLYHPNYDSRRDFHNCLALSRDIPEQTRREFLREASGEFVADIEALLFDSGVDLSLYGRNFCSKTEDRS